jgi:hypothetical protein
MAEQPQQKKRVFVFGNGISQIFGVPNTNQLLSAYVGGATECPNLVKAVKYLYPDFEIQKTMFPGIEDLMGKIVSGIGLFKMIEVTPAIRPQTLTLANREVHKLLLQRLWTASTQGNLANSALQQFADIVQPQDTIITLNWDVLVERVLTLKRKSWGYIRQANQISILKLHGSINWFSNRNAIPHMKRAMPGRNSIYGVMQWDRIPNLTLTAIDSCILVPPTPTKTIGDRNVEAIWNDAYNALRNANSIFCIGYSMPITDDLVRLLLRRGLVYNRHRLKPDLGPFEFHVVNPDLNVESRFKQLVVGGTVKQSFHQTTFEQAVYANIF